MSETSRAARHFTAGDHAAPVTTASREHRRPMLRGGRLATVLSISVLAGAACSLPATGGTSGTPTSAYYVALGDSYTAGPLIPDQVGSPTLCLRSDNNYPSLVDKALKPSSFLDVSCSGATTVDMTQSQNLSAVGVTLQHNSPQFNALSSSTKIVTIGIGGNDIGFSSIVLKCAELSVTNPQGSPCKDYYTSGGTDQLATAITAAGSKIATTLKGIHQDAPNAKVFLVGYPDILPTTGGGCFPVVPLSAGDIPYLNSVDKELDQMLSDQAAANSTTFVDTYTSSIGHDVCQSSSTRWVEGILPTEPAAPVHPNASGMANTAKQVEAAINKAG